MRGSLAEEALTKAPDAVTPVETLNGNGMRSPRVAAEGGAGGAVAMAPVASAEVPSSQQEVYGGRGRRKRELQAAGMDVADEPSGPDFTRSISGGFLPFQILSRQRGTGGGGGARRHRKVNPAV